MKEIQNKLRGRVVAGEKEGGWNGRWSIADRGDRDEGWDGDRGELVEGADGVAGSRWQGETGAGAEAEMTKNGERGNGQVRRVRSVGWGYRHSLWLIHHLCPPQRLASVCSK